MKARLLCIVGVVPFVMLAGCQKPPTQELNAAKAAVDSAIAAGAPTYVPMVMEKAQNMLSSAQAAAAAEDQKNAMARNYGPVIKQLDEAATLARQAATAARKAAEEAAKAQPPADSSAKAAAPAPAK